MRRRRFRKSALKAGYRSGLEHDNQKWLKSLGAKFTYEEDKIPYQKKISYYTPDFKLSNGIYVEVKGFFKPKDRSKHLTIKDQHPDLDIRFVFDQPNKKLSKISKTTYAGWAERHGFQWAEKLIPEEWINE